MATYLVTRHGSNAANQSMTPEAILGWVEAKNRTEAAEKAADRYTCYNNQFFSFKPASKCSQSEADFGNEAEWSQEESERQNDAEAAYFAAEADAANANR